MNDAEPAQEPPRGRGLLRAFVGVLIALLLVGDVALYSLYQALRSRVWSQEHRVERLHKLVTDMIKANQNAEKIEKIETQVDGIETQVSELTETIKEQDAQDDTMAPPGKKKKKRSN